MGVPVRRQGSADRPAGRTIRAQEPPVESRRLQGSQIGLAKGAVQTGRVAAEGESAGGGGRQRVLLGVCSWGGTAINAWGVMLTPLSKSIYRRMAHTCTPD